MNRSVRQRTRGLRRLVRRMPSAQSFFSVFFSILLVISFFPHAALADVGESLTSNNNESAQVEGEDNTSDTNSQPSDNTQSTQNSETSNTSSSTKKDSTQKKKESTKYIGVKNNDNSRADVRDYDNGGAQNLKSTIKKLPARSPQRGAKSASADGTSIDSLKITWLTEDTTDDGQENNLYLQPTDNAERSVTAQIDFSLSGEYNYEAGDVQIRIPAHIFKDRDGNNYGNLVLPLKESPSTDTNFNWSLVGDEYVLTNARKLSAASHVSIQLAYEHITPSDVVDMAKTSNLTARLDVLTHNDNTLSLTSDPLTAQIDTYEEVTSATKAANSDGGEGIRRLSKDDLLSEYPDAQIPDEYADETEFVVVRWYTYARHEGNTNFTLGYNDSTEPDGTQQSFVIENGTKNPITTDWRPNANTEYQFITTAYPASQFEPEVVYTLTNKATWTCTETDDQSTTTKDAVGTTTYLYHEPTPEVPGGNFYTAKWGDDNNVASLSDGMLATHNNRYTGSLDSLSGFRGCYGIYSEALNTLLKGTNDAPTTVDTSYTEYMIGYTLPWTRGENTTGDNVEDYDDNTVTMTLTDGGDHNPLTFTDQFTNTNVTLEPGTDFTFTGLQLVQPKTYRPYKYDGSNLESTQYIRDENGNTVKSDAENFAKGGSYGVGYSLNTDPAKIPNSVVEVQVDGNWQTVATVDWSDGKKYASVDFSSVSGTITAFRVSMETSADCVAVDKATMVPSIRLISNDKTRAVAERAMNLTEPEAYLTNTETMTATQKVGEASNEVWTSTKTGDNHLRGYKDQISVIPSKEVKAETDNGNQVVNLTYTASVEERSNIVNADTWREAVEDGGISSDESCTWYDLLPIGVVPDLNSITLRKGDTITDAYTIANYKGTGRTLLVVKADLTPTAEPWKRYAADPITYYEDKPTITFNATYTFQSILYYGSDLHNVIAYASDNQTLGNVDGMSGEKDDLSTTNNSVTSDPTTFADDTEKSAMTNLDPNPDHDDYTNFVYAGVNNQVSNLKVTVAELNKQVMVNGDGYWGTGVTQSSPGQDATDTHEMIAYTGANYQYRLSATAASDTQLSNIVLYDVVEDYTPTSDKADYGDSQWKGLLRSVDTSYLEKAGVKPVVYYSTVSGISIPSGSSDANISEQADLTNTDVWSTTPPSDLSTVTAVAIDCTKATDDSNFVLQPGETISAYLNMKAPSGADASQYIAPSDGGTSSDADGSHAYNNVYMWSSASSASGGGGQSALVRKDYTKVGLKTYEIKATKSWDDDNNRDGVRPSAIKVELYKDGVDTGKYVILDGTKDTDASIISSGNYESDAWIATFKNLEYSNEDGTQIHYSFVESLADGASGSLDDYNSQVVTNPDGDVSITNIHEPESVTVSGTKTWEGDSTGVLPRTIRLTLKADGQTAYDLDGNEVSVKYVSADPNGNWNYTFTNLPKYHDGGVAYTYTVDEEVDSSYIPNSETTTDENGNPVINYTNTYHPYGNLKVSKRVEGTDATDKLFKFTIQFRSALGGDFSQRVYYDVYDSAGNKISEDNVFANGGTIQLSAGQYAIFKEIPKGTTYTVAEAPAAGYTNDSGTQSGTISPNEEASAAFTNTYTCNGTINLAAKKNLSGANQKQNLFRFQLNYEGTLDSEGNVVTDDNSGSLVAVASNTVDGDVTFGALHYTKADEGKTFVYTLFEQNMGREGVTYSEEQFRAHVTPTDNGDGTMSCAVTYYSVGQDGTLTPLEDASLPTFTNNYYASGSVQLTAYKTLQGRDLQADEFSFQLEDADGNKLYLDSNGRVTTTPTSTPLETTNTAAGLISFPEITYTQEDMKNDDGTYAQTKDFIYVAKEIAGSDDDVSYTDKTFAWKVSVTDNGKGSLGVTTNRVTQNAAGEWENTTDLPVFENALKPGSLSIQKDATNNPDPNTEFTYTIKLTYPEGVEAPETLNYTLSAADSSSPAKPGDFDEDEDALVSNASNSSDKNTNGASSQSFVQAAAPFASLAYSQIATLVTPDKAYADSVPTEITEGTAYGVLLSSPVTLDGTEYPAGTLVFIRSNETYDAADEGTVVDCQGNSYTGKIYPNIESDDANSLWSGDRSAIKKVFIKDKIRPAGTAAYFAHMTKVEEFIGLQNFDASQATDFLNMFQGCDSVKSIDVSSWDLSNAQRISFMFADCDNLETITLPTTTTDKITEGSRVFSRCPKLTTINNLGDLNVTNVTHLGSMFEGDESITSIDVSAWTPTKQVGVSSFVSGCKKLKNLKLPAGFVNSNVIDGWGIFYNCSSLEDFSGAQLNTWDMSKNRSVSYMFYGCESVKELDLSSWRNLRSSGCSNVFYNCHSLQTVKLGEEFCTSKSTELGSMFYGCSSLTSISGLEHFDTSNVTWMSRMFYGCSKLPSVDVSSFNTAKVIDVSEMFYGCSSLKSLDISAWNEGTSSTSKISRYKTFLNSCRSLETLNLGNLSTESATTMEGMFRGTTSLKSIDVSSFNTSKVTNMLGLFQNTGLESIDISAWNEGSSTTANVTSMASMFAYNPNLKDLNLGNLNTSSVTSMFFMFVGCPSLEYLDLSSVTVGSSTVVSYMFDTNNNYSGATRIKTVDLGTNFRFKTTASATTLSQPKGDVYTGKWVMVDGEGNQISSTAQTKEELADSYDGTQAGRWTWERVSYTVTYNKNPQGSDTEAAIGGSISPQTYLGGDDPLTVANGSYYYMGYEFTGWNTSADGSGTSYSPGDTFTPSADTTLYAQWKKINTQVTKNNDGTYTLKLKEGEKATFDNLPAGTTYEVIESTAPNWKITNSSNTSGVINPNDESEVKYENDYEPGSTTAVISASKSLDNKAPKTGEFSFVLKPTGENAATEPMPSGATGTGADRQVTIENTAGSVTFAPITYAFVASEWAEGETQKTYNYEISENTGNNANYTYDTHTEQVQVVVTRDADNNLSAVVQYDSDGAQFVNNEKKVSLSFTKAVQTSPAGATAPDTSFEFQVTLIKDGQPLAGTYPYSISGGASGNISSGGTISLKAGQTATINNLPVGTLYTISEVNIPNGWTQTGVANKEGTLVADNNASASFTNTYSASGSVQLAASKNLFGATLGVGDYSFMLTDTDTNQVLGTVSNGSGTNADSIVFEPITYDLSDVGTHHYRIDEVQGTNTNISYDKSYYSVDVEVKDNGNGTLSCTPTYHKFGEDGVEISTDTGTPHFDNNQKLGNVSLTKTVEDATAAESGQVFTFDVELSADGEYTWENSNGTTGKIANGGTLVLKDGETVTIKDLPSGSSYKFSERSQAGFTVTDSENLEGDVVANETSEATITNTYKAQGLISINATKNLTGTTMRENEFSFLLTDESGSTTVANATNDSLGKVTFNLDYSLEDLDGAQSKTFVYKLKERNGGTTSSGITFDSTVYTVKIDVTDKGDGTLECTPTYYDESGNTALTSLEFNNSYKAQGVIQLKARKFLDNNIDSRAGFSFSVCDRSGNQVYLDINNVTTTNPTSVDSEGNVVNNAKLVATSGADGYAYFTDIPVTAQGKYTYYIKENSGNDTSWDYDENIVRVDVDATDDGLGRLVSTYTYYIPNTTDPNGDAAVFTNTRLTDVSATKNWENADGTNTPPAGATVMFELYKNGEPTNKFITLDGNVDDTGESEPWKASWTGLVKYENNQEIVYTVKEVSHYSGYSIDDDEAENGGTLTNKQDYTTATLNLKKTISNAGPDRTFTFELHDSAGNQLYITPGGTLTTNATTTINGVEQANTKAECTSDATTGLASFGTFRYTEAKNYSYLIHEVAPDGAIQNADGTYTYNGVTYQNDTPISVSVTKDATTGELQAQVTSATDSDGNVVINNLKEAKGTAQIEATKRLVDADGNDLSDWGGRTYSFTITPDNGAPLRTSADGESLTSLTSSTASQTSPTATFDSLYFKLSDLQETLGSQALASRTFTYTITENNAGESSEGVTNTTETHKAYVTITSNPGSETLSVQVTYDNATSTVVPTFTNTYIPAPTKAQIFESKSLTGRDWLDADSFTFTLSPISNDAGISVNPMPEGTTLGAKSMTVTKDSTAVVNGTTLEKTNGFGEIEFTKAGTYRYSITEEVPAAALAYSTTGTPIYSDAAHSVQLSWGTADSAQKAAGYIWVYQGVTYENVTHTVEVKVTDNGDGTMTAKTTYLGENNQASDTPVPFVNTYTAKSTSTSVEAYKLVNGYKPTAGTFSVDVIDNNDNHDGISYSGGTLTKGTVVDNFVISGTGSDAGHGSTALSKISFTKAGTYSFILKETKAGTTEDGYTYDDTEVNLTVTVKDNLLGELYIDSVAYDPTYTPTGGSSAGGIFENTYTATGEANLSASKNLEGRNWRDSEQYTFELTPVDNAPIRTSLSGTEPSHLSVTATASNTTPHFDTLYYTLDDLLVVDASGNATYPAKTFTYQIREQVPDAATATDGSGNTITYGEATDAQRDSLTWVYEGVTYSAVQTVKVNVSDNGNGTLKVTYGDAASDTFTPPVLVNSYQPSSTKTHISLSKSATTWASGGFTFQLTAVSNSAGLATTPMPQGTVGNTATVTVTEDNPTASFADITFTKAGDYDYTVTEVLPSGVTPANPVDVANNIIYDTTTHRVRVHVTDNLNGTMTPTIIYDDGASESLSFSNGTPANGAVVLSVGKSLTGANLRDGEFTYNLYQTDSNFNIQAVTTKRISSASNVGDVFTSPALSYSYGDIDPNNTGVRTATFYYVVQENNAGQRVDGVTYDGRQINIEVQLSMDNTAPYAIHVSQIKYTKSDSDISYTETYDASGNVSSTTGTKPGFKNAYHAVGSASIQVNKAISGRQWIDGEEHSFTLSGVDSAPVRLSSTSTDTDNVLTAKATKDTTGIFDELIFTQADLANGDGTYANSKTFRYKIHEQALDENGVDQNSGDGTYEHKGLTYAADQYVTVTVTDNGDGNLNVSYGDAGSTNPPTLSFTNSYRASGGTAIEVEKDLQGRPWLTGDSFNFTLSAGSNTAGVTTPMPTTTSVTVTKDSASHRASFGTITYTAPGVYHYTISETQGSLGGVTYDTTQHEVTVTVTDKLDGTLDTSVDYTGDNTAEVFENDYQPTGTNTRLTADKNLFGRILNAHEFGASVYTVNPFEHSDATPFTYMTQTGQGSAITGGASTASMSTKPITYTRDALNANTDGNIEKSTDATTGLDQWTATYYFKETIPSNAVQNSDGSYTLNGVTYSTQLYRAKVLIKDDGVGNLVAETPTYELYDSESATWSSVGDADIDNAYAALGTAKFSGNKEITGRAWNDTDTFKFQAVPVNGAPLRGLADNGVDEINYSESNPMWSSEATRANRSVQFPAATYKVSDLADKDAGGNITGYSAKTFVYKITEYEEVDNPIGGITYSDTPYYAYVNVSDSGSGTLNTAVTYGTTETPSTGATTTPPSVTNPYRAQDTTANIKTTKNLSGRDWLDSDSFGFTIKPQSRAPLRTYAPDGSTVQDNTSLTAYATKNAQTASFGPLVYNFDDLGGARSRTFTYKIVEDIPVGAVAGQGGTYVYKGVTYQQVVHTAYVTLTDNGDGTMSTAVSYDSGTESTGPTYTNTYRAQPTHVRLDLTKNLEGKDLDVNAYSFVMKQVNRTDNGDGTYSYTAMNNGYSAVVSNSTTSGLVSFGNINLEGVGTYYYEVSENIPAGAQRDSEGHYVLNGVTYDTTKHHIAVEVVDGGEGQLQVGAITIDETTRYEAGDSHIASADGGAQARIATDVVFTNKYQASGSAKVEALKSITSNTTGRVNVGEPGQFTFELYEGDNISGKSPIASDSTDARGNVTFYGTHPQDSSKSVDELQFDVSDLRNADGTYGPQTFYYTVHEQIPADAELVPGTSTYAKDGYIYTATDRVVEVTVSDNGDGTLHFEYVNQSSTPGVIGPVDMVNDYEVQALDLGLQAKKSLTGRDMNAGEFTFTATQVADEVGNPLTDTSTNWRVVPPTLEATNAADGSVSFGSFNITHTGTYYFKITENVPVGAVHNSDGTYTYKGVTYDNTTYVATVVASDNGNGTMGLSTSYARIVKDSEGKLKAEKVTNEDGSDISAAPFANDYEPNPAKLSIDLDKALVGRSMDKGEFSFTATQVADAAGTALSGSAQPIVAHGTNDASGKVIISNLEVKKTATYYFKIAEDIPSGVTRNADGTYTYKGVTYDNQSHILSFRATDNLEGQTYIDPTSITLDGTAVASDAIANLDNGAEVSLVSGYTFNNSYTAAATELSLSAKKTLDDKAPTSGRFSFELSDADGNVMQTVKNDGRGSVNFDSIEYDEPGTYTYTICEKVPSGATRSDSGTYVKDGVYYDGSEYKAIVKVVDGRDGSLRATVSYEKNGSSSNQATFKNTTKEPPSSSGLPSTGDPIEVALLALVAAIIGSAAFVLAARCRKKDERP